MTAPLDAEADAAVYRFYWVKRLAVLGVVLVVAVVASWFAWSAHERHRLEAEEKRWQAAGLSLSLEGKRRPSIPDEENGALLLVQAIDAVRLEPELAFPNRFWPVVGNAQQGLPFEANRIRQELEPNRSALGLLHRAAGMRAGPLPRAKMTDRAFDWSELEPLVGLKKDHADLVADEGNARAFYLDLADLNAIRRLLLAEEMNYSSKEIAWEIANDEFLLVSSWLRKLPLTDGTARKRAEGLVRELSQEGRLLEDLEGPMQLFAAGAVWRVKDQELNHSLNTRQPSWVNKVILRAFRPAAIGSVARQLEMTRSDINSLRASAANHQPVVWAINPPSPRIDAVQPAAGILQEIGSTDVARRIARRWTKSAYMSAMDLRLEMIAIAAKLYGTDHAGALPPSLGTLAPKYLPALPVDPYDPMGNTFHYSPLRAGQMYVYTFGEVGIDLIATGRAPAATPIDTLYQGVIIEGK